MYQSKKGWLNTAHFVVCEQILQPVELWDMMLDRGKTQKKLLSNCKELLYWHGIKDV